jgi:hypothetical protein
MIKLPLYRLGLVQKGSAGKEVRGYHSQKRRIPGGYVGEKFRL